MTIPTDYPLESFDPRFIEILKRGARGDNFTIQCKSPNEATRIQHMLHSARKRAKVHFGDERPEMWRPLYLAIISRIPDEHGRRTILHIRSRHDEFADTLSGIVPDLEAPRTDPLDEFFAAKSEGSGGE